MTTTHDHNDGNVLANQIKHPPKLRPSFKWNAFQFKTTIFQYYSYDEVDKSFTRNFALIWTCNSFRFPFSIPFHWLLGQKAAVVKHCCGCCYNVNSSKMSFAWGKSCWNSPFACMWLFGNIIVVWFSAFRRDWLVDYTVPELCCSAIALSSLAK